MEDESGKLIMEPREPANGAAHVPCPPALRTPRRDPRAQEHRGLPASPCRDAGARGISRERCRSHRFRDGRSLGPHQSVPHAGGIRWRRRSGTDPKVGSAGPRTPSVAGTRSDRPPCGTTDHPHRLRSGRHRGDDNRDRGGGRSASPGGVLAPVDLGGSSDSAPLEKLKPGLLASNPFGVSTSTTRSAANASARAVAHPSRISSSRARRVVDRP